MRTPERTFTQTIVIGRGKGLSMGVLRSPGRITTWHDRVGFFAHSVRNLFS